MNSKILIAVMIVCAILLSASAGNYYKAASNYNEAANNYTEAMANYHEAKADSALAFIDWEKYIPKGYCVVDSTPARLWVEVIYHQGNLMNSDIMERCCQDRLEVFNEGMALGWENGVAMFKRSNMQYTISPDYDVLDNPILHNPPLKNVRAWAEYYRLIGCEERGPPGPNDADRLERMGGGT